MLGTVMASVLGMVVAPPAAAAQEAPTITVTPASDLLDGAPVMVAISGLEANSYVQIAQCRADADEFYADCDTFDSGYVRVGADGAASLQLRVDALLTLGFEPVTTVDCREEGACAIAATVDEESIVASAPLDFVADGPLAPAPVVTVTPDEDLSDLQTVRVEAEGLVWSRYAYATQCAAATTQRFACDYETEVSLEVDDAGTAAVDYPASAVISTSTGTVDCREPGACVLRVSQDFRSTDGKRTDVPLHFDPDTEVVPPELSVTPHEDLVDGQRVRVEGEGFRSPWLELSICGPEPSWDTCQRAAFPEPEDGAFAIDIAVFAQVVTESGEIDCRTSDDPCLLVASTGNHDSPRAGRTELHFDPDGPLLPGPEVSVDPSTNLGDQATVTVTGSDYTPFGYVTANVCAADDLQVCDFQTVSQIRPDREGSFSFDLGVAATFVPYSSGEGEVVADATPVDCRVAPGCVVSAYDTSPRIRRATAPLGFAPPATAEKRYLDPIFDVSVTHDVVYRDTTDALGNPVQLKMDIYEPAGDTAAQRPAVVWMGGGWFSEPQPWDTAADIASYADAFARRGYVAITMEYRQRPGLCCPTRDAAGITETLLDGYDDAAAGIAWLKQHAAEYRIDPRAIAAGGESAGAANAYGLAYLPGQYDRTGLPGIAAALPISGVSLGSPDRGEPPVLAFHGSEDNRAPDHLSDWTCDDAGRAGIRCDVVSYPGAYGAVGGIRQRDIISRSADFLAEVVLEPLGYIDPPHEHPTSTTTSTTTSSTVPGSTATTAHSGRHGSLPRTGSSSTVGLFHLGLALATLGTTLLVLARWRRRLSLPVGGDRGGVRLIAPILLGLALLAALVAPAMASAQEDPPHPHPTTTTTGTDPTTPPSTPTTSTTTTMPSTTTTVPGTTTSTAPGSTTSTTHPPGHGDPPPAWQFPPDWTPEQVAKATQLIHDTEAALGVYENVAILPLMGYQWIHDGVTDDTYQHWINTSWVPDSDVLDPNFPESLVLRTTPEGPVLEAAMFILGLGYNMDTIPADIRFYPGWHIHDNLCFEGFTLVGIAVNGQCERGTVTPTPPMLHVWVVDTPCGRFAGVDENGLQCHHHPHD